MVSSYFSAAAVQWCWMKDGQSMTTSLVINSPPWVKMRIRNVHLRMTKGTTAYLEGGHTVKNVSLLTINSAQRLFNSRDN